MKLFLSILLALTAFVTRLNAQSVPDTTKTQQQTQQQQTEFIDEDGDGICDNRTEGLSFKRNKQKHEYGKNQSTQGLKGNQSAAPQGKSNQYRRGRQ